MDDQPQAQEGPPSARMDCSQAASDYHTVAAKLADAMLAAKAASLYSIEERISVLRDDVLRIEAVWDGA